MAFLLHPIQYAVQRCVDSIVQTPERGARISGKTTLQDLDVAANAPPTRTSKIRNPFASFSSADPPPPPLEAESLAFSPDVGFQPTYLPPPLWKRPHTSVEAQRLYNHARTVAWYADSLPLLETWRFLPFNVGVDSIIGLVPGLGDIAGAIIGVYLVGIVALFGLPFRLVGIMLLLVTLDTLVGAVPLVGDALDVAFKSNLYILYLLEHHLVASGGKCGAGTFQVVMPPSGVWFKQTRGARRAGPPPGLRTAESIAMQPQQPALATSSRAPPASSPSVAPPPDVLNASIRAGESSTSASSSGINAGGGGPSGSTQTERSIPRRRMAPFEGQHLPAMPLSLPSEFRASEEIQEQAAARSNSNSNGHGSRRDAESAPLLASALAHGSADKDAHHSDNEYDDDEDEESDEQQPPRLVFPDMVTSPGRPRVASSSGGTTISRSRSRSKLRDQRRPRGVSWHADIQGGYADGSIDGHDSDDAATTTALDDSDVESHRLSRQPSTPSISVAGRRRRYLLIYSAIFAIAYVTSLDANTGYLYLNFACSEFGALASFSTVAICQQMVFAIAKPPIAKLSDVFGRAEAFLFALAMYSSGYAVVASANSLQGLIGGIVLQSAGNTGVQVLQSIVIADLTTAKWRGLVISLVNLPYLINFAVAGPLVDAVMQSYGWRVGYGMWSLVVPMAAAPLVIVLAVGQKQARDAGLLEQRRVFGRGCGAAVAHISREIDALGLALFTLAWTLLLGPLTLAGHGASASTSRTAAIASMCIGCLLLIAFTWWERRASNPIMPLRFLGNGAVVCICLIGVLDFASFYLSWTYLSAFVQIVKDWGQTQTGYFATTQNVTSTIVGIIVGSLMACTRRFKLFLVGGVMVRFVGVALMIRYRNSHDPTVMLVLCQLLQGIGGGSVAITMQIAAQVCVRHADVAIVTALELLTTEIGAAMGSAAAGLIFSTLLPAKLRETLGPGLPEAELREIYGSLSKATSFPMGSPERSAIVEAWTETMKHLCVVATVILVPTLPLALAVPDFVLPDSHKRAAAGEDSHHHHHHHHRHSSHRSSLSHLRSERQPLRRSSIVSAPLPSSNGGSIGRGEGKKVKEAEVEAYRI